MKFNEVNHSYYNEEGELYVSATAFIKKFVKPFEREKIAAKYAKKNKKTVKEVIEEWTKLGDDAVRKGTAYHKIKELELLGKESCIIEDEEHLVCRNDFEEEGIKVSKSMKLEPGVYPELIVWSDRYKIAGQADYVEVTKKGKVNIKDYKTSKEIKKHAFEKWDGTKEMMKFPVNNLEDCNFSHYALQINLYAFLIRQYNRNLKLGKLEIEHIIGDYDQDKDEFKINQSVFYEVPDLQDEVRVLLEYHKNKQNA